MNRQLANVLITKKILIPETKITANVWAKGLMCQIRTLKDLVISHTDINTCVGYDYRDPNVYYKITFEDITKIEGMEPGRFAQAYNLKEDGSEKRIGKKPGRKTKKKG